MSSQLAPDIDAALAAPATAARGAPPATAPATQRTVLCVDDEPNILSALRRLFRGPGYRVLTADSGAQALEQLAVEPVDLIISDMRMPGMDGSQLLEAVRQRWPQVTRVLLTGHADIKSTIAAINRGEIYRYVTKPWDDDELRWLVRQAFERLDLQDEKRQLEALTRQQNESLASLNASLEDKVAARTAELGTAAERLRRNYLNSIKVLSNLIELRSGALNGHARKVADLARRTAQQMGLGAADSHDVFIAGLLHDIGHIGLSEAVLSTPLPLLSADDRRAYEKHAELGELSLLALDDMKSVAALVRAHHERVDGHGFPDRLAGEAIPLGARILAVADAFDDLQSGHLSRAALAADEAKLILQRGRGTQFDPVVLDAFIEALAPARNVVDTPPLRRLPLDQLQAGMVLGADLRAGEGGIMLLACDHVLNAGLIQRIRSFAERHDLVGTMVAQVRVDRPGP